MFQSKGKGGKIRAGSKRPETRTFVPETLRLGSKPKAPVELPRKAPEPRQSTQPFVPETVRFSNLIAVQVGGQPAPVPAQARPTPLPQGGVDMKGSKKKRDSSLLGLIVPSLGKKSGNAPRPPSRESAPMNLREPTMDVSDTDLSLVESSTHELEMTDLSSVADLRLPEQVRDERYVPTEPPPPPSYRKKRRSNRWVLWGAVGSAWCGMIALALFAVDDDDGLMNADKPRAAVVEQAPAALTAMAPAAEDALRVSPPDTGKPLAENGAQAAPSEPVKATPSELATQAGNTAEAPPSTPSNGEPAATAGSADAEQLSAKKSHHRERRVHKKRGGRHGKLTPAQKKKRMKKLRAQRRAAERG